VKKILISVLIILLLILNYFAFARGISFLKIKSINDIKNASNNLGSSFNEANVLSNKTYPTEVENLERAIKQLKISKQEYENKNIYSPEGDSIGAIEIKTYKIHYLWTILGNYRKDRGVQALTLDLKSTPNKDVYDLEFTLVGTYTRITDFLYDVENDEELNFEIQDFSISLEDTTTQANNANSSTQNPAGQTTTQENNTNNKTQQNNTQDSQKDKNKPDGKTLYAKFTVENVGITLD